MAMSGTVYQVYLYIYVYVSAHFQYLENLSKFRQIIMTRQSKQKLSPQHQAHA